MLYCGNTTAITSFLPHNTKQLSVSHGVKKYLHNKWNIIEKYPKNFIFS